MRKLETADVFAFSRCIKRMGVKDRFKDVALEADTLGDIWSRGFDLVWDLFDLATETKGEKHLLEFLAGPFEMTPEELSHLPLDELIEGMQHIAQENNLLRFFKLAAKLTK